ncbi:MAG: hypothetical protein CMJ75_11035 [Planctomycetaceae bacterium]|nr:hypothetical protein [Planctomycetaceae bacterium]
MDVLRETGPITDYRKGIPAREYGSRADYPQKSSATTTGEIQQIGIADRIATTLMETVVSVKSAYSTHAEYPSLRRAW